MADRLQRSLHANINVENQSERLSFKQGTNRSAASVYQSVPLSDDNKDDIMNYNNDWY